MTTKLTLTIKKSTIERAKSYAKSTQRSLSEMVQKYLDELVSEKSNDDISPKVKKIAGIVKLPKNYTDEHMERDRREYLEKKYL